MHTLSSKDSSNPFEFIETIQLLNISYLFKGYACLVWLVPCSTQPFLPIHKNESCRILQLSLS